MHEENLDRTFKSIVYEMTNEAPSFCLVICVKSILHKCYSCTYFIYMVKYATVIIEVGGYVGLINIYMSHTSNHTMP